MLAGAVLALWLGIALLPAGSRLAQSLGGGGHAQETANYRRDLAVQGFNEVKRHLLLGQPSQQLIHNLSDLTQGQHIVDFVNSHLFVAMTAGVPLFFIWLLVWLTPVAGIFRQRTRELAFVAPLAIVVTSFTALTFTSLVDRNMTWFMIALGLSASSLQIRRRART